MLLSFRRRLTVSLCPTQIAVSVTARGWRSRSSVPVAFMFEPAASQAGWQAPLAALGDWLAQQKYSGANIDIIVSDSFVRYALIPWSGDVQKPSEFAALARIHFEALFGPSAAGWDIRIDRGSYGQPVMCCALDKAFLSDLHALLKTHKLRLASLQPYFMRACNRWRRRIKGNALFAVNEAGQCVLSSIKNGGWHSIRTVRLGHDAPADDVSISIEREVLLQGLDEQSLVYLHALAPVSAAHFKPDLKVAMLTVSAQSAAQQPAVAMLMQGAA